MLFWIYLLSNMAILGNVKFQCGIYYKVDVSGPGKPTHTNQQAARWVAFSAHVARCVSTTSTISQLCSPCRLGMATRLAAAFSKTLRNVLTLGIQSPCQMMIGVYNMYSHLLSKIFRFHSFFYTSTFKSGCQLNPSGMVNWHPETEPLPAPKLEGGGIEKWIRRIAETS